MRRQFPGLRVLVALALLAPALSGCLHVPLEALWRLRKLEMLKIDPANIRIAARIPGWLDARPGTASILLKLKSADGPERELKLALVEAPEEMAATSLAGERRPGSQILAFRIGAADVARLRALQAEAQERKAAHPDSRTDMRLSLDATTCRRAPPPPGEARVDFYLSLGDSDGFFKVYQDIDLRDTFKPDSAFEAATPPCAKP